MKLLAPFKEAVEGTPLASIYRTVRDEWRWIRSRQVMTPLGYRFTGREDMQTGVFEPDEVALIQESLSDADVFVDVGANIGYFVCLARSMGKRTIAIEPFSDNLRYLIANLEINGWVDDVEVYPVGVADKPGLAMIHGGGTGASLISGWAGISQRFGRMIPLTTLDILIGGRFTGKRVVVKIDVEGAEHAVLQGASKVLMSDPRPIWLMEVTLSENWPAGGNPNFLNTFELMWSHGYRTRSVGPNGREISPDEVREYAAGRTQPDWATTNYVFTVDGH